ncbi:MAG: MFS transporter, partial [Acidobacteriota bacterium]
MVKTTPLNQGRNATVALLSTAHLVTDSYSSFLGPLLPLLTIRLHLTPARAGLLIPTMMITTSLMQPVYGMISDRYLKRSMAVYGPLVAAIFFSLIGQADSLPLLIGCVVAGGIGIGAFHPQSAAMVSSVNATRRATTMSVFSSAGTVGVAVGPILITSIVASFGLERTYLAMIFGVAMTALLWRYCPPLERVRDPQREPLHRTLRTVAGPLSILYFAVVLRSAAHVSIQTYLPFMLTDNGLRLTDIGWVLSGFIFFGGIGGLFGGTLADRFGARRVSMMTLALAAPFLGAAVVSDGMLSYL